jgi:hypothetical protein
MSICPFTIGADYNCADPIQPGLFNYVYLINKSDISSYTITSGILTNITLKPGKVAYKFEGIRGSFDARYEQVNTGFFSTGYRHIIEMSIYDISSDGKVNIEKLALNDMVGITFLSNSPGNDNTYFEVYGLGVGLETVQLTRINTDLEYMGAFRATLQTSETLIEGLLPLTYFNTDYATSKAEIDSLLQVGTNVVFPFTFPFNLA